MQVARSILLIQAAVMFWSLFAAYGCSGSKPAANSTKGSTSEQTKTEAAGTTTADGKTGAAERPAKPADPIVVVHTSAGDFKVQLFAQKSPQTVDNFLTTYAARGFYDQTIFHHVEAGSMLIGGGYTADMQAKPPRTPIFNESRNGLLNRRGTIAMIREADAPHSATSQFFINLDDNPNLDFKAGEAEDTLGYCVFGEVISGIDVVEKIAHQPTTSIGDFAKVPSPAVAIQSIERLR
jgi:cyclophilin family peptidyl-prolyl cis-trans isomerase